MLISAITVVLLRYVINLKIAEKWVGYLNTKKDLCHHKDVVSREKYMFFLKQFVS